MRRDGSTPREEEKLSWGLTWGIEDFETKFPSMKTLLGPAIERKLLVFLIRQDKKAVGDFLGTVTHSNSAVKSRVTMETL